MKTALCLSGQLRRFKTCQPSIQKHLIEPFNSDVYISTWGYEFDPHLHQVGWTQNEGDHAEAHKMYNPKGLSLHYRDDEPTILKSNYNDIDIINQFNVHPSTRIDRFLLMTFKIMYCHWQMERLGGEYDLVIRSRFDLDIRSNLLFGYSIKEPYVVIPEGHDWLGGINDQLAWGNLEGMRIYNNLHKFIQKYAQEGVMVHPETMLKHHLDVNKVTIARVAFDYGIVR